MKRLIMALLMPLFLCACSTLGGGGDPLGPESRAMAHDIRIGIEPIIENLVVQQNDAELSEKWEKAKEVADSIGGAWDAYLLAGSDENGDLHAALTAGLNIANDLVPLLTGDPDKVLAAQSAIAILRVVISAAARDLEAPEIEAEAEALGTHTDGVSVIWEPGGGSLIFAP